MKKQNKFYGLILSLILLVSCNNERSTENTTELKNETVALESTPPKEPEKPKQLTPEELEKIKPNELGLVMILEYHRIGRPEERWTRTPENFRKDLELLYKEGYYLTPLRDFVNNTMDVPAGKTPFMLTFDDGTEGQFRYLEKDGETIIDPDSAVGILEDFTKKHPDFGKASTFYVLPRLSFGQAKYAEQKLKFLNDNGYEIGNHTLEHSDLTRLEASKINEAIGAHVQTVQKIIPDYEVNTLAYPYGGVPKNLDAVGQGEYQGTRYKNIAALLVGANPAVSPNSNKFKPLLLPRIQAIQSELDNWLGLFRSTPALKYISDGNKDVITIPKKLVPSLEGTLREDLNDKELVTY